MKEMIIKTMTELLFISSVLYFLASFVLWVMNPHLSKMEVFLAYWPWGVCNIFAGIEIILIKEKRNE